MKNVWRLSRVELTREHRRSCHVLQWPMPSSGESHASEPWVPDLKQFSKGLPPRAAALQGGPGLRDWGPPSRPADAIASFRKGH